MAIQPIKPHTLPEAQHPQWHQSKPVEVAMRLSLLVGGIAAGALFFLGTYSHVNRYIQGALIAAPTLTGVVAAAVFGFEKKSTGTKIIRKDYVQQLARKEDVIYELTYEGETIRLGQKCVVDLPRFGLISIQKPKGQEYESMNITGISEESRKKSAATEWVGRLMDLGLTKQEIEDLSRAFHQYPKGDVAEIATLKYLDYYPKEVDSSSRIHRIHGETVFVINSILEMRTAPRKRESDPVIPPFYLIGSVSVNMKTKEGILTLSDRLDTLPKI